MMEYMSHANWGHVLGLVLAIAADQIPIPLSIPVLWVSLRTIYWGTIMPPAYCWTQGSQG